MSEYSYSEEIKQFQQHLAQVITSIEGDEDINILTNNIALEYEAWRRGEIEDMSAAKDYEQMLRDDLCALEQQHRFAS